MKFLYKKASKLNLKKHNILIMTLLKLIIILNSFIIKIKFELNYIKIYNKKFCYFIDEKIKASIYINFNCKNFIYIKYLNEIENYKKNLDMFFINGKNTKIENILSLFPFLKNNSVIFFRIKKISIYKLIKGLLKTKIRHKSKNILLYKSDLLYLYNHFNEFLHYEWELIPSLSFLNNIRYIINNYYDKKYIYIYDKIINFNLKIYIKKNKSFFSYKKIKKLMSKSLN